MLAGGIFHPKLFGLAASMRHPNSSPFLRKKEVVDVMAVEDICWTPQRRKKSSEGWLVF